MQGLAGFTFIWVLQTVVYLTVIILILIALWRGAKAQESVAKSLCEMAGREQDISTSVPSEPLSSDPSTF